MIYNFKEFMLSVFAKFNLLIDLNPTNIKGINNGEINVLVAA
jgi:hypothetical protein